MSFFSSPGDQAYMWYPELKNLDTYDKDDFNVLLLDGSALTEDWGSVPQCLEKKLELLLDKEVNIVNLAAAAHSSLDSVYKYGWIKDKHFDLVVFYHGINEVRANNVPPGLWKKDYSHYSWYDEVSFRFKHSWLQRTGLVLPYFIKHLLVQLDREVINRDRYVPEHTPRPEWLEYGSDIKTRESFRDNLQKVIATAGVRGEPLMVMTYAYYLPESGEYEKGSSFEKFIEVWGDLKNIILGIKTHNQVVRELAAHGGFMFLDQQEMIDNNKIYFSDICHFSRKGSEFFAENIVNYIKGVMPEKENK